jgi:hypothetical protein
MPQINREELLSAIDELRSFHRGEREGWKAYYKVAGWIKDHEFYLSAEQCKEINVIFREMERRYEGGPAIAARDLRPNEDMDDSYFFEN